MVAGLERPLTKNQRAVIAVIADAKNGEIAGLSIATWLLKRHNQSSVRETLRSLVNRGLIEMRPMDDPTDEFRRRYPDRMKALYRLKIAKEELSHALSQRP